MTGPLAGLRVVVTRPAHQAGPLLRAFEEAGARAEPLPLLSLAPPADLRPLERAAAQADRYDWAVFTSANAVRALLQRLPEGLPAGLRAATVGPATARELRHHGVEPALVARDRRAAGLAAELLPRLAAGARVLLPQAADARPVLSRALLDAGFPVDTVVAYAKQPSPQAAQRAREIFGDEDGAQGGDGRAGNGRGGELGWVTFTSPRIAQTFAALFGTDWPARRATLSAASIGPVTSRALRRLGVRPAAQADHPGDRELVAAVVAALEPAG